MFEWTAFEWIENILFYAALYVLLWNAWFLTVSKGIPNIRTAPAIRKKMADFVREDIAQKKKDKYTIIDMGAGNGDLSRYMARTFPEAHVIGVEIDKIAYWKCCFYKKLLGYKNLTYRNESFHYTSLKEADAIVMFLSWLLMNDIRATLEKKLSKNTLITSNKFPIGGDWVPEHKLDVKTLYFHQKSLYVYHSK